MHNIHSFTYWKMQLDNMLTGRDHNEFYGARLRIDLIIIIENEWNTVLAARCCVQAPLVCTCEGDYHSSSSILTSSGRVAPRVSILGPALLRSSDAGLSSWLLQTLSNTGDNFHTP